MQLTRGQKDAIQRKAMAIINEKVEKRKAELIKAYKPSKEAKKALAIAKELIEARNAFYTMAKKYGFKVGYYGVESPISLGFEFTINDCDKKGDYEELEEKIRNQELNKLTKDEHYPSSQDVMDEIELLNITKDFDVEKFLEKYKNL